MPRGAAALLGCAALQQRTAAQERHNELLSAEVAVLDAPLHAAARLRAERTVASVEIEPAAVTTSRTLGCIGVDINADHLAVAELDRFGNLVDARCLELPTRGKSGHQAKALIGNATVQIAALAKARGKPLALEKLDFQKRKAELEAVDPARARKLSSFVFSKMIAGLKASPFKVH